MTWHIGPLLAFDIESSGVDVWNDRIVTISLVTANATQRTSTTDHWILNPGIPIPDEAAEIHGYTTERLAAEGVDPKPVLEQVATRLAEHMDQGLPVVAYNARFDCTLLNCELERHSLQPLEFRPVVDPFVIDKQVDRYRRGKRTLTAACETYNVALDGAHDAAADAIAAARLAWRLGQHPNVADLTLNDLHDRQQEWAADQALGLRDWFVSSGKMTQEEAEADVHTGWPIMETGA